MTGKPRGRNTAPAQQVPKNNQDTIAMVSEMLMWPAIDLADPDKVRQRVADYYDLCSRYNSKILVSGLCACLGLTRHELIEWSKGKRTRLSELLSPESAVILQNVVKMLEVAWESSFQNDGYRNPVTGIFLAKNNFGYKDESSTLIKHEDAAQGLNRKELQAKYAAALPEEPPAPTEAREVVVTEPETPADPDTIE